MINEADEAAVETHEASSDSAGVGAEPSVSDEIEELTELPPSVEASDSKYELDEAAPLDDANIEETLAELQGVSVEEVPNEEAGSDKALKQDETEMFSSDFDELIEQVDELDNDPDAADKVASVVDDVDDADLDALEELLADEATELDEGGALLADIKEIAEEDIQLPKVELGEPFVDDVIELSDGSDDDDKNQ